MSFPTPHLFEKPRWQVFHAIGWIQCRSKDQFGAMNDLHDFRAEVFYGQSNPWKAARPLLDALQIGSIQAMKDGQLLPPEYWDEKKLATTSGLYLLSAGAFVPSARVREQWQDHFHQLVQSLPLRSARAREQWLLQAPGPQPQADAPEIAEPAAVATPHVIDQEAAITTPDAAPGRSSDQALVEKEIWKEFPEGVPLDWPPRRVMDRVRKGLPTGINTWTINRAVKNCRRPA